MTENLMFGIGIFVLLSPFLSSVGLSFLVFFLTENYYNCNVHPIDQYYNHPFIDIRVGCVI